MIKYIINTILFKWFRKSFIKRIEKEIISDNEIYCCRVESWHSNIICWKELKEVDECLKTSLYTLSKRKLILYHGCDISWFDDKQHRLLFLKEVLSKF